ncbi:pimeloyl-ACP methyl ester carboxylesterase [Bradyrhizobium sp. USDA 4503]
MLETHGTAPTRFVEVNGVRHAFRRWGKPRSVPLLLISHLRAGMDHWDPVMTDGLAENREVILFNGRGVASSEGEARNTIEEMADDIAAFLVAISVERADVGGFSLGGMQVQELALRHPQAVRKLLLLGTGPRGMSKSSDPRVPLVASKSVWTAEDISFLFFGPSNRAKAAGRAFWARRHLRADQDPPCSPEVGKAQFEAGQVFKRPIDGDAPFRHLRAIAQPTLVVNGIDDIMIPAINSFHLAANIPLAHLVLYEDAGHGAHFQYPERFLKLAIQFLDE